MRGVRVEVVSVLIREVRNSKVSYWCIVEKHNTKVYSTV